MLFIDFVQKDELQEIEKSPYFREIANEIYVTSNQLFAEITVKTPEGKIPFIVKEIVDCFNLPINVHVDFFYVIRSKKR